MKARATEDKFELLVIFENSYELHSPIKVRAVLREILNITSSVNPQLYSHSDDYLEGEG